MLKTYGKHKSIYNGVLMASHDVPVDYYMQLYEICYQLTYMGERRLALALADRLDEIFETMDSGERKELAIQLANYGT